MKPLLPQRCPVALLYMTWVFYLGGFAYLAFRGGVVLAAAWLLALPAALWAYVRVFPHISGLMGYGNVDDVSVSSPRPSTAAVTMYGSAGCPFCPLVLGRLIALQQTMGFVLRYEDVTLRPDLARKRRILSVPVVEVDGRRLVGHATSEELEDLIVGANRDSQ